MFKQIYRKHTNSIKFMKIHYLSLAYELNTFCIFIKIHFDPVKSFIVGIFQYSKPSCIPNTDRSNFTNIDNTSFKSQYFTFIVPVFHLLFIYLFIFTYIDFCWWKKKQFVQLLLCMKMDSFHKTFICMASFLCKFFFIHLVVVALNNWLDTYCFCLIDSMCHQANNFTISMKKKS